MSKLTKIWDDKKQFFGRNLTIHHLDEGLFQIVREFNVCDHREITDTEKFFRDVGHLLSAFSLTKTLLVQFGHSSLVPTFQFWIIRLSPIFSES